MLADNTVTSSMSSKYKSGQYYKKFVNSCFDYFKSVCFNNFGAVNKQLYIGGNESRSNKYRDSGKF